MLLTNPTKIILPDITNNPYFILLQFLNLKGKQIMKKKTIIIASAAGIIAVSGIIGTILALRGPALPDPEKDKDAALRFVASEDFGKLKPARQTAYVRSLGNPRELFRNNENLTEEQRQALRDNLRRSFEREQASRMRKFFNANETEKNRMLDEDLARAQNHPQRQPGNQPNAQNANQQRPQQAQRTPPSAQEMREREASSNPLSRAQNQVYRELLRQRRQQQN